MGQQGNADFAEQALEARGRAVLFDACAAAFLREPDADVVAGVRAVQRALGVPEEPAADAATLHERFSERLFVPVSPYYVPLQESCVYGSAREAGGRVRYGSVQSSRSDHVHRCYKAVGFDMGSLAASELVRGTLHADYLGCELAFLAYLSAGEAAAWEAADAPAAEHWHGLAERFAREHAGAWFSTAAERLVATEEDFYARTCALAADCVQGLLAE